MSKKSEPIGFISPSQWLKCQKLAEIMTAAILTQVEAATGRVLPKKNRRFIHGIIDETLRSFIADPQMTFMESDEPDAENVALVREELGARIPVVREMAFPIAERWMKNGLNVRID